MSEKVYDLIIGEFSTIVIKPLELKTADGLFSRACKIHGNDNFFAWQSYRGDYRYTVKRVATTINGKDSADDPMSVWVITQTNSDCELETILMDPENGELLDGRGNTLSYRLVNELHNMIIGLQVELSATEQNLVALDTSDQIVNQDWIDEVEEYLSSVQ